MKTSMCIIFLIILSMSFVSSQGNMTVEQQASNCLNNSLQIMKELAASGFNVSRINDSIKKAEDIFNAQIVLDKSGKTSDFSYILPYCSDIENIKDEAYLARDDLYSVKKFYNDVNRSGVDMSQADKLIAGIEKEIADERYEQAREEIPEVNSKIVEIQASATTVNLFYRTTTRGIGIFVKNNWIYILAVLVFLSVFFVVYKTRISRYLVLRKINRLEEEKKVLKNLIQKIQKDYFEKGDIPEVSYHIKIKQFSEMIRDIDRQIPLLQEQLVRIIGRQKWKAQFSKENQ